jgi:hypothetical protein
LKPDQGVGQIPQLEAAAVMDRATPVIFAAWRFAVTGQLLPGRFPAPDDNQ